MLTLYPSLSLDVSFYSCEFGGQRQVLRAWSVLPSCMLGVCSGVDWKISGMVSSLSLRVEALLQQPWDHGVVAELQLVPGLLVYHYPSLVCSSAPWNRCFLIFSMRTLKVGGNPAMSQGWWQLGLSPSWDRNWVSLSFLKNETRVTL